MRFLKKTYIIKLFFIFLCFSLGFLACFIYLKFNTESKITMPLPISGAISGINYRCEGVLSNYIGSRGELAGKADYILAKQSSSTQLVNLVKKGEYLEFISGTSFEVGDITPAKFIVLGDTGSFLTAVLYAGEGGFSEGGLDTFILNKKTGVAIWNKSRPSFISGDYPDSQSVYMTCQGY